MFTKILVPIDGSDPARHALSVAAKMAEESEAELILLSVVPSTPIFFSKDTTFTHYSQLQQKIREGYEEMLKQTTEDITIEHEDLKVKNILEEGNPENKIVSIAKEEEVDLIVIGNKGTGGIVNWMLGSTSRNVVEACTVPVLVVKDRKYCEAT